MTTRPRVTPRPTSAPSTGFSRNISGRTQPPRGDAKARRRNPLQFHRRAVSANLREDDLVAVPLDGLLFADGDVGEQAGQRRREARFDGGPGWLPRPHRIEEVADMIA